MVISLTKFESMDPYILASAVNMQLRDTNSTLDELCRVHEINKEALIKKLKKQGLKYDEQQRQFK